MALATVEARTRNNRFILTALYPIELRRVKMLPNCARLSTRFAQQSGISRNFHAISRRFPDREAQISRRETLVKYRKMKNLKNNCDLCFTLCKVFDYSLRVTRHQLPRK